MVNRRIDIVKKDQSILYRRQNPRNLQTTDARKLKMTHAKTDLFSQRAGL